MQSQLMFIWELLNNSTGGVWTTFHDHMHDLVATYIVAENEYANLHQDFSKHNALQPHQFIHFAEVPYY